MTPHCHLTITTIRFGFSPYHNGVIRGCLFIFFFMTTNDVVGDENQGFLEMPKGDARRYFDLTLEELINVEVTSVSKKAEKLSETSAAVYVLTQEDIHRSGATSVPEALRMVPGLNVRRINSNIGSIAIRGVRGRFADRLLVLIDGRSLLRQSSGSTLWEAADIVLSDIDRIEVIRGPGATIWGSNAVDGVINIMTKHASATEGSLIEVRAGNEEKFMTNFRYGNRLNQDLHYRVFGKFFERDSFARTVAHDREGDWQVSSGGLRLDWDLSVSDRLLFQVNYFNPESIAALKMVDLDPNADPPFEKQFVGEIEYDEYSLLASWHHHIGPGEEMTLQAYFIQNDFHEPNGIEHERTVKVEFQHHFNLWDFSDVNWGLEYRYWDDVSRSTEFTPFLGNNRFTEHFFNTYIQDRVKIFEDRLYLTVGSKFEHSDFTGWEYQPSLRLFWKVDENQSAWSSISRAVTTPTPSNTDGFLIVDRSPFMTTFQGIPIEGVIDTKLVGTDDLKSEELIAYELGYRLQISNRLAFDLATFYNDYSNVPTTEGDIRTPPDDHVMFPAIATVLLEPSHKATAEAYGVELSSYWQIVDFWRLTASYTWFRFDFDNMTSLSLADLDTAEKEYPRNQVHFRSFLDLPYHLQFDTLFYYSDNTNFPDLSIGSRIRLDFRLAWRPHRNLEMSLVIQDVLDDQHPEHGSFLGITNPVEAERSYYGSVKWSF